MADEPTEVGGDKGPYLTHQDLAVQRVRISLAMGALPTIEDIDLLLMQRDALKHWQELVVSGHESRGPAFIEVPPGFLPLRLREKASQ